MCVCSVCVCVCVRACVRVRACACVSPPQHQTLVYDILPPTTAITDYTIGLGKLSANGKFFVGAQKAVSNSQPKLYQEFLL